MLESASWSSCSKSNVSHTDWSGSSGWFFFSLFFYTRQSCSIMTFNTQIRYHFKTAHMAVSLFALERDPPAASLLSSRHQILISSFQCWAFVLEPNVVSSLVIATYPLPDLQSSTETHCSFCCPSLHLFELVSSTKSMKDLNCAELPWVCVTRFW